MSVGKIALATMPATASTVTGIRKSVRSVRSDKRSPTGGDGHGRRFRWDRRR